jgi:hypothetical protein
VVGLVPIVELRDLGPINKTKIHINETMKYYPINMNGLSTSNDLNIIPLGSYDILIGMDWLDKHRAVLDFHNKTFTCLDEEGK